MLPKAFAKKVDTALAQNALLFKSGSKQAASYIADLQKEVRSAIVGAKGFELVHLKSIRDQLEKIGIGIQKKLTTSLHANQDGAFSLGSTAAVNGFKAAGITLALPKISQTLLTVAKDYSADLIQNLSKDAIEEISGYLRRGIINGDNPYKTMERIDNNVFADEEGLFGRAETIVRTENARMYEVANQNRLEEISKSVPGMMKIWVATDDERTRDSHKQAGIDYGPDGNPGPIPIDEPFIINGEEVAFPADPEGDPHECINCRCASIPYIKDWEKSTVDLTEAIQEGSSESGNHGHAGRPGQVGGSGEGGIGDNYLGAHGVIHVRVASEKELVAVYKNPTDSDKEEIRKDFMRKYRSEGGTVWHPADSFDRRIRILKDVHGNIYAWSSGHAIHSEIQPILLSKGIQIDTSFNAGSKLDDRMLEGGSGSGNFGHAGRPGEIGGSGEGGSDSALAIVNTKIEKFVTMIRGSHVEVSAAYDKNGKAIFAKSGDKKSVYFTAKELEVMRDADKGVHNHPDCNAPFSRDDINFARTENIRELVVVSSDFNFSVTPFDGKTWPAQDKVNKLIGISGMQAHKDTLLFSQKILVAELHSNKAAEQIYNKIQRDLWKESATELGLIYKQERI